MKKFNKASAAVISGAIIAVIGAVFQIDIEILASVQTLITAGLVLLVPNAAA